MQPFRHSSTPLPSLDQEIQDFLVANLSTKLSALEALIRNRIQDDKERHRVSALLTDAVLFLARLLQFDLGFPGAWTKAMKDAASRFTETMLRLAITHGGPLTNPVAFTLLLDTACYIFDGESSQARSRTVLNYE